RDHHVAVEEDARTDLDPRLGPQGQPDPGFEMTALPQAEPPLFQRFQDLALDRMADVGACGRGVPVYAQPPKQAVIALIPAPLAPPDPPSPLILHPASLGHGGYGCVIASQQVAQ